MLAHKAQAPETRDQSPTIKDHRTRFGDDLKFPDGQGHQAERQTGEERGTNVQKDEEDNLQRESSQLSIDRIGYRIPK